MADHVRIIEGELVLPSPPATFADWVVELRRAVPVRRSGATALVDYEQLLARAEVRKGGVFTLKVADDGFTLDGILLGGRKRRKELRYHVFVGTEPITTVDAGDPTSATHGAFGTYQVTEGEVRVAVEFTPVSPIPALTNKITGVVVRPNGFGVEGLKVKVVGVGADVTTLPASAETDVNGRVSFTHTWSTAADVVLKVYLPDGTEPIGAGALLEDVEDYASDRVVLPWDVSVATSGVVDAPSLFERLDGAFGAVSGGDIDEMDAENLGRLADKRCFDVADVGFYFAARALTEQLAVGDAELVTEYLFALVKGGEPPNLPHLAALALASIKRAVSAAVSAHDVPATLLDEGAMEAALEVVAATAEEAIAPSTAPTGGPDTKRSDLHSLATAFGFPGGVTAPDRAAFRKLAAKMVASDVDDGAVFEQWRTSTPTPLSHDQVGATQMRLQLARIFLRHTGCLAALQSNHGTLIAGLASNIVWLTDTQIRTVVADGVGTDPLDSSWGLAGTDAAEWLASFKELVLDNIEDEFPSALVVARLAQDTWSAHAGQALAKHFFDFALNPANRPFDLESSPPSFLLSTATWQKPGPVTMSGEERAELTAFLEALQRVFRLTDTEGRRAQQGALARYDQVKAVLLAGYGSAWEITQAGVRRFLRKMGPSTAATRRLWRRVYDRAEQQAALALATYVEFDPAFDAPALPVLPSFGKAVAAGVPEAAGLDDLGTLSPTYTEPPHGDSVLGPAAYLVDLFGFLRNDAVWDQANPEAPPATIEVSAADLLFAEGRRPDIGRTALSAQNAETTLPQIDLVNELLATIVAGLGSGPSVFETTGTSAERRAAPQRLDPAAYAAAAGAVEGAAFPLALPRALPLDRARALAQHLSLDLGVASWVFRTNLAGAPFGPAWVQEQLQLHPGQWERATAAPGGTPSDADRLGFDGAVDTSKLQMVDDLKRRFGLTHDELLDLVAIPWMGLAYGSDAPVAHPLDLAAHYVFQVTDPPSSPPAPMTAAQALKLQGVVRLARATGWPIPALARALSTLAPAGGGGVDLLSSPLQAQLAVLCALQATIGRPADELLAVWAPLSTEAGRAEDVYQGRSPFDRVFVPVACDDALRNALAAVAASASTPAYDLRSADTAEPTVTPGPFASPYRVREAVRAATGLSGGDFDALLAVLEPDLSVAVPASLASVSKLLGLALVLKLSEAPARQLNDLLSAAFGAPPTPGWIGAAPFSAAAPTALLRAINTLRAQAQGPIGPDLIRFLGEAPASAAPFYPFGDQELARGFSLDEDALCESLGSLLVTLTAIESNPQSGNIAKTRTGAWVDWFAAAAGVSRTIAECICSHITDATCMGFVSDEEDESEPPTAAPGFLHGVADIDLDDPISFVRDYRKQYLRLYLAQRKAALLFARLGTTDAEVVALLPLETDTSPPPGLSPDWGVVGGAGPGFAEAVTALATTALSWPQLDAAQRLFALRPLTADHGLVDVMFALQATASAEHIATISAAYGWGTADVEAVLAGVTLSGAPAYPAPSVDLLEHLATVMEAARGIGASAPALVAVFNPAGGTSASAAAQALGDQLEQIAAARDNPSAWSAALTAINDKLRVQERDALLSLIIGAPNSPARDAKDVYDHLLIDPLVEPSVLTSRVIAATNSAQLLVQRILLGLEGEAALPQAAEERWAWLKSYRVWEAARKVFLWPENWLQPELRGGRTPEFDELLGALNEAELDDERARTVWLEYLSRLADLSKVRVLAITPWKEDGDDVEERDELYLFGRSQAAPQVLLWRRRETSGQWTPWVDCGLQVEGEHLLPVVHNGRMLCVWPTFEITMRSETKVSHNSEDETVDIPGLYITLNCAELRGTAWAPPAASSGRAHVEAVVDGSGHRVDPRNIYFRTATPTTPNTDTVRPSDLVVTAWVVAVEGERTGAPALVAGFRFDQARGHFDAVNEPRKDLWATTGGGWKKDRDHWTPPSAQPVNQAYYDFLGQLLLEDDAEEAPESAPAVLTATLLGQRLVVPTDRFSWSIKRSPGVLQVNGETYLIRSVRPRGRGDRLTTDFHARELFREGESRDRWAPPVMLPAFDDAGVAAERPRRGRRVSAGSGDWLSPRGDAETPRGAARPGSTSRGIGGSRGSGTTPTELRARSEARSVHALQRARGDGLTGLTPAAKLRKARKIQFVALHHPYVDRFLEVVRRGGVMDLLRPDPDGPNRGLVRQHLNDPTYFTEAYGPSRQVATPHPVRELSFDLETPAGLWNWELFFHAPMAVAAELRRQQQHERALDWMHTVFNPLGLIDDADEEDDGAGSGWRRARRAWRVRPLAQGIRKHWSRLRKLMTAVLDQPDADVEHLADQLAAWRDDPFDPHRLAGVRVSAYRKWVVMTYLDTLLEWGDALYMRDTRESINEAMQLYAIVQDLLGPRPVAAAWSAQSLGSSALTLDALREGTADPRGAFATYELRVAPPPGGRARAGWRRGLRGLDSLIWFAVPPNLKLLGYWTLVEDRIAKIRRGANIAGMQRPLALLAPELDPGALIAAVMAGQGLSAVLQEATSTVSPTIRFSAWVSRAGAVVANAKALGSALQSALEKADGELLGQLRQRHELAILELTEDVRRREVDEAEAAVEGLRSQIANATWRADHYRDLIADGWSSEEVQASKLQRVAQGHTIKAENSAKWSSVGGAANVSLSWATGKGRGWQFGVSSAAVVAAALGLRTSWFRNKAGVASLAASQISTRAGYSRRAQDWRFQMDSAEREARSLAPQLQAAELRLQNAQRQLQIFRVQREHAAQVETFLRTKYSNATLYQYQADLLRTLYYRTYQLAFNLARLAEESYNFELGTAKRFIRFGYWNGARGGLLAGEQLHQDLERMEVSYIEDNRREREIVRPISLAWLDPVALEVLREKGHARFRVPELVFDMDHGYAVRRTLHAVSVTVSAVSGRFTAVNGMLSLEASSVRALDGLTADTIGFPMTITLSHGQEDAGVFQLDYNDPRYVPFERLGAISDWKLALAGSEGREYEPSGGPIAVRQIDWRAISDVVLTLRYRAVPATTTTGMPGTPISRTNQLVSRESPNPSEPPHPGDFDGFKVGLSAARDFPDAWQRFMDPGSEDFKVFRMTLRRDMLPTELIALCDSSMSASPQFPTVKRLAIGFRKGNSGVGASHPATVTIGAGGSPTPYLVASASAGSNSVALAGTMFSLATVSGVVATHTRIDGASPAVSALSLRVNDELELVITVTDPTGTTALDVTDLFLIFLVEPSV